MSWGRRLLYAQGPFLMIWILSNVILALAEVTWLVLPSAALLFGFLPGFLLVNLLFGRHGALKALERAVLNAAVSYGLSSLVVLATHFIPGPLTRPMVVFALNGLILLLVLNSFFRSDVKGTSTQALSRMGVDIREIWPVVALISLIVFFRFVSLGYSELQGDEVDVASLARLAILGDDEAVFLHRKGPVELVTAAAFALVARNFEEFALRFPFAVASGWAILGTYELGRQALGRRVGLLAASLLALNGIFLGFSRMAQYQGIVSLVLVAAVLCYYRLNRAESSEEESRWGILGLGLWGVGLLTHYEAGLVALILAFLYRHRHSPSTWRWVRIRPLCLALVIVLIILAAYYVPFVAHEHFSQTFQRYTTIRISPERAPFNNLGDYLTSSLFYNSIYHECLLVVGFLAAAWVGLREAFGHSTGAQSESPRRLSREKRANCHGEETEGRRSHLLSLSWPGVLLWLALCIGLLGGAIAPSWFQVAGVHIPLFLCLPALIVLTFGPKSPAALRTLFLWFGSYLIVYAFLIRVPGLHYYTLLPAYMLLAAWGLDQGARELIAVAPLWRYGVACGALLLTAILLYYPYLLFVRTTPEYALSYPQHRNPLYWNTLTEPPQRFFGLPHRSGWRSVGYLWASGQLAGEYRTNEKAEISSWYVGQEPSQNERPKYYLIADNATNEKHKQDYPRQLLAAEYEEIGRVTVSGEVRLHIYGLSPAQEGLGDLHDEFLASRYHEATGLGEYRLESQ